MIFLFRLVCNLIRDILVLLALLGALSAVATLLWILSAWALKVRLFDHWFFN